MGFEEREMKEELEKLAALNEEVASLEKQIARIHEDVVSKYAPVKEGDVIEINGHSHNGKKMLVEKVVFRRCWGRYEFYARGPVLKKDGTPGQNWGEWAQQVARD